jgi:hypothetical protein
MKFNLKAAFAIGVAALTVAFSNTAAAQGTITFDTANFDDFSKGQTFFNSAPVGAGFVGQIYISSTLNGTYTAIGTPVGFRTDGGIGYIQGTDIVTGSAINSTVFYQVRAWNSAAGSTFEQASASQAGIVGISESKQVTLGGTIAGSPPTVIPFPLANQHTSFSLAAVPEPTTVALAVMGGLGLLARRRRNQA